MKKINWAIVGFGHIGRRHAENIISNEKTQLVAICDCKEKENLIFDGTTKDTPFFDNIDKLLSSTIDIDVISVCVPNGLHFDIASRILKKGIIAVIEKPIVLTKQEADELIKLSDGGRLVYGVLQNRYTSVVKWLKELISSDKLGNIYRINMACLWNRDERYYTDNSWHGDAKLDGGTLFTQYSHFIDIILYLFGDIDILNASFENYSHKGLIDFEDTGTVDFQTKKGTKGNLFYSTSVYGKNIGISLDILAEYGSIRLSGPFLNKLEHCQVKGIEAIPEIKHTEKNNDYGMYSGSAANHNQVIDNIAKHILSIPAEIATMNDALNVVNTINQIYKFKQI